MAEAANPVKTYFANIWNTAYSVFEGMANPQSGLYSLRCTLPIPPLPASAVLGREPCALMFSPIHSACECTFFNDPEILDMPFPWCNL